MANRNGNSKTPFTIQISPFDGDPNYVSHFFNLIEELALQNNWSNEQTILFFKSKLSGPALKFFLEDVNLAKSDNLNTILLEFKNFFVPDNTSSTLNELNKIQLLPDESIRHFAHRLQVLTHKVYTQVTDENALSVIKYNKFISALPANLRIKLLEENIQNFKDAVQRAHQLQDILNQELVPKTSNSESCNTLTTQLADLAAKVNALTLTAQPSSLKIDRPTQNLHRGNWKNRSVNQFRNKNVNSWRKPNHNIQRSNNYICQLCNKKGHSASRCFKFTRLVNQRSSQPNQRRNCSNTNSYFENNNSNYVNENSNFVNQNLNRQ